MSGIQPVNPKGLSESSHYGYAQITVVPPGTTLVCHVAGRSQTCQHLDSGAKARCGGIVV